MKIRNITDPNFNDTVFGVQFTNGIGDLSQNQIEKLRAFGRFEFEIVKEECESCKKLSNQINELHLEIERLRKKGK